MIAVCFALLALQKKGEREGEREREREGERERERESGRGEGERENEKGLKGRREYSRDEKPNQSLTSRSGDWSRHRHFLSREREREREREKGRGRETLGGLARGSAASNEEITMACISVICPYLGVHNDEPAFQIHAFATGYLDC